MVIAISNFIKTKRGFTYSTGKSCDCQDKYLRHFESGTVIIQYFPCRNGKRHRTCAIEYKIASAGNPLASGPLPATAQEFDDLLKLHNLIPQDTELTDVV